jgi:predicted site-specific integrase-resolvase
MIMKIDGQKFYSVSDACSLAGISRVTFLRWVRQGKFVDVDHRNRNGWRLFTEDDLNRLKVQVNIMSRRSLLNRSSMHGKMLKN